MNKIGIVGAGRVGEAAAWLIAQRGLCEELVLLEVVPGLAAGVALDIQQAAPLQGFRTRVHGGQRPDILRDAGIVIIAAGAARKPGMTRLDLQTVNVGIMEAVLPQIREHAPLALVLVVTNPADVITYHVWRRSALPRQRVIGFSGVLDSSRMAYFLARATGDRDCAATAMVIGGHGDSMVPLVSQARVNGVPAAELLNPAQLQEVIRLTRQAGTEILNLKKTSTACIAPAAGIARVVDAIVHDRQETLPAIGVVDGEYGLSGMAIGVPCVIGARGIESIVQLELAGDEQRQFRESAERIRDEIGKLPV
jgi:malate dehydrogenase